MTELIDWFASFYDKTFMSAPSFKTIIFAVTLFCTLQINILMLRDKEQTGFLVMLIVLITYMLFIPLFDDSALKVWCYYPPCQIFTFALGLYGLLCIRKNLERYSGELYRHYRSLLLWIMIFSVLIVIEDTIVIFNVDTYSDIMVKIQNRSICEDIESIFYSIYAICILGSMLINQLSKEECINKVSAETVIETSKNTDSAESVIETSKNADSVKAQSSAKNDYSKFYLFSQEYQLTTREQDILKLLLDNKNNTEISEALFISVGTAKAHVHNIFAKVDIKKRQQLIDLYKNWEDSAS